MPIMARRPNGEYTELFAITPTEIRSPSSQYSYNIAEIRTTSGERIFRNWKTYDGALPATLAHTLGRDITSYKIWGNVGGVGVPVADTNRTDLDVKITDTSGGESNVTIKLDGGPLKKDEYVDSAEQKIYRLTDNLYKDTATSGTSYTTNGVTYTYDGIKWTAVGTATAYSERTIGTITLPAGTYYLWGIDSKAANPSNVRIRLMSIAVVCNGSNEPVEFTLTEETTLLVRLVVGSGTDANGTEFEPFIATYSGYLHPEELSTVPTHIMTFAGTTTISYDGMGAQPEKVELIYKLGV